MSTDNILTIEKLMTSSFKTGDLTVNFNQNRVSYQHKELVLQPKVLELLVLLCAAQGQTLSKQTLTTALWPDTIVGPDSLANTVTRLRKVLNDNAKQPEFIETVQRKGYRWCQDVNLVIPNKRNMSVKKTKTIIILTGVMTILLGGWLYSSFVMTVPEVAPPVTKFPFPDLYIERLPEGGYEVQVGIDGELTEERKAAMLKEIKRITGEEHSDMIFTIDPIEPSCKDQNEVGGDVKKIKAACKAKPLKTKPQ